MRHLHDKGILRWLLAGPLDIVIQPNVLAVVCHDGAAPASAQGLRETVGEAFATKRSDERVLESNMVEGSAAGYPAHDDRVRGGAHNPVLVNLAALGFPHISHAAQAVLVNEFLDIEFRSLVVTHYCRRLWHITTGPAIL